MNIETRDILSVFAALIAIASMLLVNRNARRATAVTTENTDLTRIRDLRAELRETKQEVAETKQELHQVKNQVTELSRQLTEASNAAMEAYQWRAEALRYARMPGMDMETWIRRFDAQPPAVSQNGA